MREKWARLIVIFTGLVVTLLAMVFALIQNPTKTPDTPSTQRFGSREPIALDAKRIQTGQRIYQQQNCAACHSIAGKGNPRNPLDGIGTKHRADDLRNWIIGTDTLQGQISQSTRKLKQVYRKLSDDDLEALTTYLRSLR